MIIYLRLLVVFCCTLRIFGLNQTFFYEKMHNFGLGKRIIPRHSLYSFYAHPEVIATKKPPVLTMPSPYRNLYQGRRIVNDTRVYKRKFDYSPKIDGQLVYLKGLFDCLITFLAIETTEGIPIIVRGGVGYRHFLVVAKARPWKQLSGTLRAYCKRKNDL